MAAVTTIVTRATWAARTAFESRAGWTAAVWAAIWATIGPATTTTIAPAALRPLETSAWIAADARGIAGKIFARSGGPANTRGASLAGKQNDVVLENRGFRDRLANGSFDHFRFGMIGDNVLGITECHGVLGAFVGGVGFEFGPIGGAASIDFRGVFLGKFGLSGSLVFGSVELCFLLALFFLGFFFLLLGESGFRSDLSLLGLVLVEFGATGESIGFGVIGSFLVLSFG